ncbi:MAG: UDP-N-acetylglucosamine--N-acetylmuramyl-(pentapeptide) pyrophosphoryl-undecaprenol N-acetylglucosamine transferase [Anaerolineaceae bacterium]|nr:UDP-N-acetylglucosamine--N-acetylmuramyl-(pentapeptide) pyrophosphoryl-undecaprenol N-acetylglucosamine transferase [Anaerolineaceae bacterium]
MRLLICAGGTGGGVYPALTVLQALGSDAAQVLWVGSQGGMEASLVQRAGIPFTAIPAAGVHGVGLRFLPRNLRLLFRGVKAARQVLSEFQPDVLLYTGGYVAASMALAARRYSSLVYVPDIEPGLALKFLARFADIIAVTAEESRSFLPGKKRVVVTGYPTRLDFGTWDPTAARASLGMKTNIPVLLVFGGSQGARSINQAVSTCLPELLETIQVLHIAGEKNYAEMIEARERLPEQLCSRYYVYPYLHEEMPVALAAADLAVSRAGAATLGEYPRSGLPAILVPYPHAWRYQKVNAAYLAERGAAVILPDEHLSNELLPLVKSLFANTEKRKTMRTAMCSLASPNAASQIAGCLRELASSPLQEELR